MRCPVLVGRDRETAVLADAVEAARSGTGTLIAIIGEPGVGKTRLAQHAVATARERDVNAAVGRSVAEVAAEPLRPIAEALLTLVRGRTAPSTPSLAGYIPTLAALVPQWRTSDWRPPAEAPFIAGEAILLLLAELAGSSGLVLVLEDVQWADARTRSVIRYLCDHIDEIPVVLVLTARDVDPDGDATEVIGHPSAVVLPLKRLAPADALVMAAACLGAGSSVPEAVAERLARDAEGLPLLVEDLVASDVTEGAPRRFADTVRVRLDRLDPAARTVLAVAAALGRTFDWRLLSPATGLDASSVGAALHAAAALQLIATDGDGFSFRHALTREVVLRELDAAALQAASRAAAHAVAAAPTDDDVERDVTVGRLLGAVGDREDAVRTLLGAARRALAAGRVAAAESTLHLAAGTVPSSSTLRGEVDRVLARVLLEAGRPVEAAASARAALAGAVGNDPDAAGDLLLLLARAAMATDQWAEAVTLLERARRDGRETPARAAETAVIQARIALGEAQLESRLSAEHQAAQAAAIARASGRPDLECEALELVGLSARLRDLDDAAAAFGRALLLTEGGHLPVQRLSVLNELGVVEMLRDARSDRLEEAREEAVRLGLVGLAAGVGVNLAAVRVMTGRLDEGETLATDVGRTASRLGLQPLQAAAEMMVGLSLAYRGRRREADDHLARAEVLAPGDPDLVAGVWALGRGLLCLIEEDRAGARHAFRQARIAAPDVHARVLNPFEGPDLLLRCLEGEARRGDVRAVVEGSVRGARWSTLWLGTAEAVAIGAEGDREGAGSALAAAVDAGAHYPVFRALAVRLAADGALAHGWQVPLGLLREAELTFAGLSLSRPASACRALLHRSGAPAPRRTRADLRLPQRLRAAGVTAREAEVLALLADNLPNKEIGVRLYASPRTVEKHVAALRNKLEVADRFELGRLARAMAAKNGGDSPM